MKLQNIILQSFGRISREVVPHGYEHLSEEAALLWVEGRQSRYACYVIGIGNGTSAQLRELTWLEEGLGERSEVHSNGVLSFTYESEKHFPDGMIRFPFRFNFQVKVTHMSPS